ncbi:hypothetical protein [Paracidovorax cattleyae]|uniref:hypothetical protein n=1 Tax=Paracidovorax cattleyae TaxID=80868 RepID=UPI0018AFE7AD|nr:hypothetical protein [Paracidovorax cattleyae]MBF9263592.1 hypothetical protein [Paracidovorax cattleyae]
MSNNTVATSAPELSTEEFRQQANVLAVEIVTRVLRPREPVRTTLVLEALLLLYRWHAMSMPVDARGACALAVGGMAAELLQASAASDQSAPAGVTTH